MNLKFRSLIIVGMLTATLGVASVAEAKKIRSTVERRQQPGRGFWEDDHKSNHRPSTWQSHQSFWNWNGQPKFQSNQNATPKKKSWGWQRSSRAELHHPEPRKSR